jgi:DNA end-binding protein Ku
MARAIWTGSLTFGLVSVPVGLYSATEDKTVHFNQLQTGTADRIRNRRVNERTGEEVEFRDVVKGYEVGPGEYVVVTPDELDSVAPEKSSTIEVTDFVDLDDIDPIFFQRTYYLGPQGDQAKRAYSLLLKVMAEENKVGVATFVMRNKEYLVAVRPGTDVLVLETMYFADEIRDPREEIDGVPIKAEFSQRELATAKLLVESMTAEWDPYGYRDTYRERVEELIDRKRNGEEIVTEPAPKKPARVVDLADALQRSLEQAKNRQRGEARAGKEPREAGDARSRASRGAKSATRAGSRPSDGDLSTLSKTDLYDLATERDVAGRSKMTRRELEDAVRAAGAGGSRRKRAS